MDGRLDHLDCGVVSDVEGQVGRQRHLWETEGARVGVFAWADDLNAREHHVGHVGGIGADSEVNVDEGGSVTLKPPGLERDSSAFQWPFGAVL